MTTRTGSAWLGGLALAVGAALAVPAPAEAGATFDAIKSRGVVTCGVNTGVAGF